VNNKLIEYNGMPLLYNFDIERTEELLAILAQNMQKRRLEKGFSREALTELSGVPTPTIAKFEQKHTISLASYVGLFQSNKRTSIRTAIQHNGRAGDD